MLRIVVLALLIISTQASDLNAQELSTDIFPSEDELYEALRSGEITEEQFVRLQEVIAHKIDSSNLHLLDEIPNLSFFDLDSNSLHTLLEQEQRAPFLRPDSMRDAAGPSVDGNIEYRYYRYLEDDFQEKYQTSLNLSFRNNISAHIGVRQEYSGAERITGRAVSYRVRQGTVRELIFGNFSRRFGLGTIFGFRGKLMESSSNIDTESFLFPDYRGCNGLYGRFVNGQWEMQALVSVNRSEEHRLASGGAMLSYGSGAFKSGFIFGTTQISNRLTKQTANDHKFGLFGRYEHSRGYNSMEAFWQAGERPTPGGFVTEGRHRTTMAEIKYAGWVYSDEYIDLTGGSKAGSANRHDSLESVDFAFTSRRAGHEGAMLKTIVRLSQRTTFANSLIYASLNQDSSDVSWLGEITANVSSRLSVELNHLSRVTERQVQDGLSEKELRRTRIEARYSNANLYLRGYAGFTSETDKTHYFSLFFNAKVDIESYGQIEFWSNMSRIDLSAGQLDYWYGYVKNEFYMLHNLKTAIKFSHTYRRQSDEQQTLVSFQMVAII